MTDRIQLTEESRLALKTMLQKSIEGLETDQEKALALAPILQGFNEADVTYFTRLFISDLVIQKPRESTPQPLISIPEYNEIVPPFMKIKKWGVMAEAPKKPETKMTLNASSKRWLTATKAGLEANSAFGRAFPPQTGGKEAYQKWISRVIKFRRYTGSDVIISQTNEKTPPAWLQVTASFDAAAFFNEVKDYKCGMYKIYICLDKQEDYIYTVWSEYPFRQQDQIHPEFGLILENGRDIIDIIWY